VDKTPIYIFSTFGSKINEFEWKKLEKNLKVAGNYPKGTYINDVPLF
jgi:hypothetical protein